LRKKNWLKEEDFDSENIVVNYTQRNKKEEGLPLTNSCLYWQYIYQKMFGAITTNKKKTKMNNMVVHWISLLGVLLIAIGTILIHYGNRMKAKEGVDSLTLKITNQDDIISELNSTINDQQTKIVTLNTSLIDTKEELSKQTKTVSEKVDKSSIESQKNQSKILSKVGEHNIIDELDKFILNKMTSLKRDFTDKILKYSTVIMTNRDKRNATPEWKKVKMLADSFNEMEKIRRRYLDQIKNLGSLASRTKNPKIIQLVNEHTIVSYSLSRFLTDFKALNEKEGEISTEDFNNSFDEILKKISEIKTIKEGSH